ncbi:MAG: TraR/DksA family transcriptional regulator [Bryobacteraceae bacterium]
MRRGREAQGTSPGETYRRGLLARRAELLSSLDVKFDTVAAMGRVAEEDQAQVSHDEFISLSLNILDYQQLRLIDEALDRLRSGDYGTCLACGEPIPPKRLRVLPWARYCVPCQEREGLRPLAEPEAAEPQPAA